LKHERYDFQNNNFKDSSPLITTWAQNNSIGMFDFDECMFDQASEQMFVEHLTWAKNNFAALAIVECHPFFNTDERYHERTNSINRIADDLNLSLIFLTADYKLWEGTEKTNRTFFPDWYFRQRQWAVQQNYKEFKFSDSRKYNFSCGNKSNYRSEKVYNYIESYRRNRADWYITMYNYPQARISDTPGQHIAGLTEDQIEVWDNKIRPNIPEFKDDLVFPDIYVTNPHSTLFPVHTDSYCNLVMEHTMEVPVLSEKSFKPFIALQIPIYLAATGAAAAVTKLGFDIFYDFVDHNLYDYVEINPEYSITENFTKRIDKVHELIDTLYQTNFEDFIHSTTTKIRLQQNQDYFYSTEIDKICVDQLNGILNKY
jgi:hypothetical protein